MPMARAVEIPTREADNKRDLMKRDLALVLAPHIKVLGSFIKRLGGPRKKVKSVVEPTQRMIDSGFPHWTPDMIVSVALNMGNGYTE